jgi:predicted  nucleic acid-binding Zn-ribbon protein
MPKKSRIDSHTTKDIGDHLSAVEKSLMELRFRLKHYFKKDEDLRERFRPLEKQVLRYSEEARKEVERIVKETTARAKKAKK